VAVTSKTFMLDRSIVINALYDTFEALGLYLISSNNSRGTLVVSDISRSGELRIALNASSDPEQTHVEIYASDSGAELADEWGEVVLEELSAIIQKALLCSGKGIHD